MSKKSNETFQEYAQRWRDLTAQVEPPLPKKEMVTMFMGTLQSPFYEHMLGSISSNFTDIVIIGERIEFGLKNDKIVQDPSPTTNDKRVGYNSGRRKETEGHVVATTTHWSSHPSTLYIPKHSHISYVATAPPRYQPSVPPSTLVSQPPLLNLFRQPWRNNGGSNGNHTKGQSSFLQRDHM